MRRRVRSGKNAVKKLPRKGAKLHRVRRTGARSAISAATLQEQVAALTRELREARDGEAATAEVLRAIANYTDELEPLLRLMLRSATRICDAKYGILWRYDGELFHAGAMHGVPVAFRDFIQRRGPTRAPEGSPLERSLSAQGPVTIDDELSQPKPGAPARYGGARSLVTVPMRKDGALIGVFVIFRQEVRPFSIKEVESVKNFAAQAVIAIENARLLNELRESLEQQTATAEVLKVISRSPGQLMPVFETLLANATRLCGAKFGNLYLSEGEAFRNVATHNVPSAFAEARKREPVVYPEPGGILHRLASSKATTVISDMTAEPGYIQRTNMKFVTAVELGGFRSTLAVPMLKEQNLVGAILIYRQKTGEFSAEQIELMQNFAAQAVIAIENARLLSELRELLEQQTATSEVLKVISSSPGALEPVFKAMLENATRICEAKIGILWGFEDGAYRATSMIGINLEYAEYLSGGPFRPGPKTGLGRVVVEQQTVHIIDTLDDEAYTDRDSFRLATAELGGARTLLNVPMFKAGKLIGAIGIYRQEVRPFSEKQIELVTNFASQAVIAIENARLLNELREFYSSRSPPPMYSRSSAARLLICRPCSIRLLNLPPCCAKQRESQYSVQRKESISSLRATDTQASMKNTFRRADMSRGGAQSWRGSCLKAKSSIFQTSKSIKNTHSAAIGLRP